MSTEKKTADWADPEKERKRNRPHDAFIIRENSAPNMDNSLRVSELAYS